jgi:hypothetical protein
MKDFVRTNINGILGTIIFHLLIVTALLAARLSVINRDGVSAIMIDFEAKDLSELDLAKLLPPDPRAEWEQYFENVLRSNIAVSESDVRPVPDQFRNMDPASRAELDQRIAEIMEQAKLGKMPELPEIPEITVGEETPRDNPEPDNQEEPYTGPTNIYYDLEGRRAIWLPVPIYKCPDEGTVTVDILVNQLGYVVQARVFATAKNFNEECLFNAAMDAALKARFNKDSTSPVRQSGSITFHFQPQKVL